MKHTPGPWHILSGGFISNSVLSDWASDKHYVAQVKGGDIYNHANAHLIAAAPDLLEVCKLARKYIAKMVADNVQTAVPPSVALEKIEQAITKAERG